MEDLVVNIKRTDGKVHFEGVSKDTPSISIPFDFSPPIGEGNGFAGLELLLMSFSGCVSTAIVFLLGRSGKHVKAYTAKVVGIRREQPLSLDKIKVHICIESDNITEADLESAIKHAEGMSPVWLAVKNNINVETSFELI